jgi:hypothetical protein
MQREILQPNTQQKIGWVMFAGESLKRGGLVQVALDLGMGLKRIEFMLPQP